MIRVAVNGAFGRMGTITCQTLDDTAEFDCVARWGRDDDLRPVCESVKPDVVVDFTLPDCVLANAMTYIECQIPFVIGTSGLTASEIETLAQACEKTQLGAMVVPNFSIAAVLMMRFSELAVTHFPNVEIIECHHDQKVDAPSGTARRTAELLMQAQGKKLTADFDMPIHSVRLPHLFAHQAVVFQGVGESLTIKHDANDRSSMMPGVLISCRQVASKNRLLIGLESLLHLSNL
jgi:4-hydroxy-tetrahydrodipicolinate reductase